jgi:hypothetical protein
MRQIISYAVLFITPLLGASCAATSVQAFANPGEATQAMVLAAEAGNHEEARRIFNSFARSSIQRDKVYANLFNAAETRYERGNGAAAARILELVTVEYPAAVAAREALVYSLFVDRAGADAPSEGQTESMALAISAAREASGRRSPWVDLAATQVAIDRGDTSAARAEFDGFLQGWDGEPADLLPYVEDLDRYLQTH